MTTTDLVVIGGGPAGLGATLDAVRRGLRVTLVEASQHPGGLCRTLRREGVLYDLGGHIPFVRDEERLAWMRDLLGDAMHWVPRPVVSTVDGGVQPGRYLDQRPSPRGLGEGLPPEPGPADSAADVLGAFVGEAFRDERMRRYQEKVDGVPLERIPGERVVRLMRNQAAPEGFWFPRRGIGALMDAMVAAARDAGGDLRFGSPAARIDAEGGHVRAVELASGERLEAPAAVAAVPAGLAARILHPAPPSAGPVRMRACAIVFMRIAAEGILPDDHAWVQCDHPEVPFSRVMENARWSPAMVEGSGSTVLGMECYCQASPDDPVWGLDDAALGEACVAALRGPLGWLAAGREAVALDVVRLPSAYPQPDMEQVPRLRQAFAALDDVAGLAHAPGSEVLAAVEAGEAASRRVAPTP